uniref:uncharacterized protein LOC128928829 n=1 Tax=Callithrix jacchus TaxID=9483 RepID=UPI0023DD13D7|nr:uncharacterized protein LOC128928829 [Callithrix jacchus]
MNGEGITRRLKFSCFLPEQIAFFRFPSHKNVEAFFLSFSLSNKSLLRKTLWVHDIYRNEKLTMPPGPLSPFFRVRKAKNLFGTRRWGHSPSYILERIEAMRLEMVLQMKL